MQGSGRAWVSGFSIEVPEKNRHTVLLVSYLASHQKAPTSGPSYVNQTAELENRVRSLPQSLYGVRGGGLPVKSSEGFPSV